MPKQPHSDKSGRAASRREKKQVEQAQRTLARASQQPTGPAAVDINALLAKSRRTIGDLTMERDMLAVQLDQRDELIVVLQKALEEAPAEEEEEDPPELGEVEEVEEVEGPPEPTEEELTGEAPEAKPPDDKELE